MQLANDINYDILNQNYKSRLVKLWNRITATI
jgi:hypothetical protein